MNFFQYQNSNLPWHHFFYLFWAILLNASLFTEKVQIIVGDQITMLRFFVVLATITAMIILFFSYLKYVILDDKLEIYNILGIKLPFVIVAGPRFSKYFASPFCVISSTINIPDIVDIKIDVVRTTIPAINIKLANGKQFRLLVFNGNLKNILMKKDENRFVIFYKTLKESKYLLYK